MKTKNKIKRIFPNEGNYFFGYYDKSPWSKDGKYLLGMKVNFLDKHPTIKDQGEIVLKEVETGRVSKIAKTYSWCWQQGCMLQWIGSDFNSKIIFNSFRKNHFFSIIKEIESRKEKIIDFPIYAVCPDGKKALGLNFSRLNDLRQGYGYQGVVDKNKDKVAPENEGIYLIDLKKNKNRVLISLKDLYNYKHVKSMERGKHWVDHIGINPEGKRFCFFHRWEIGNGLFHTRLFTADLNGKKMFMFPDSGFYSHIFWKNNSELFGYASLSEKFGKGRGKYDEFSSFVKMLFKVYRKIVPRFIKNKAYPISYYILKDRKDKKAHIKFNIEKCDGHGTWNKNQDFIVTDTYPGKRGYRKLLLFQAKKKKKIPLGKFYSFPNKKYLSKKILNFGNSPFRADLHPRWNFQGNKICFDSVHEGRRNMYEIDLTS